MGKAITMEDLESINFPYYYNLVKEGKMKRKEAADLLFGKKSNRYNRYNRYVRFLEGKPTRTEAERRRDEKFRKSNKDKIKEYEKKRYEANREAKIKQWKDKLKNMTEEEINQHLLNNMIRIKKGDTVLIKRCFDCMEYKKADEFGKDKTRKDKINSICLKCCGKRREAKIQQALEDIRLIVEANPTKYDYIPGMNIYGIIYLVYNRITKRYYVGQTTISFDIRYSDGFFKYHIDDKEDKEHSYPNQLLQKDLELYGEESFEFNKLFKVASNQYELDKIEAYMIDKLEAYTKGYNRTRGNWFTSRGLEDEEG